MESLVCGVVVAVVLGCWVVVTEVRLVGELSLEGEAVVVGSCVAGAGRKSWRLGVAGWSSGGCLVEVAGVGWPLSLVVVELGVEVSDMVGRACGGGCGSAISGADGGGVCV